MINKNITIHITDKDYSRFINTLNVNDIPFKTQQYKNDPNKYENVMAAFKLPPYKGYNRKYNMYVISVPIEYKKRVIKLFKFKDTGYNYFHYNVPEIKKEEYIFHGKQTPKNPLYIVSYGRFKNYFYTVKNLEEMELKYWLCIQKKQEQDYLDMLRDNNFKYCSGLLLSENTTEGSTKQRNYCIKHAINKGYKKCWILDDNIRGWYYFNENFKHKITNGFAFKVLEDFMNNIKEPVAIMSHCYTFDIRGNDLTTPFIVNSKNYSSLLLDLELLNKYNIKFRLKYNEDVDLTLQALTHKLYTIGINFITADKAPTKSCKGGNTDTVYKGDKFLEKFKGLYNAWKNTPLKNYIELNYKHLDRRPHHLVNYKKIVIYMGLNDYITPKKKGVKPKTLHDFKISV
jgi:hypothetical protein